MCIVRLRLCLRLHLFGKRIKINAQCKLCCKNIIKTTKQANMAFSVSVSLLFCGLWFNFDWMEQMSVLLCCVSTENDLFFYFNWCTQKELCTLTSCLGFHFFFRHSSRASCKELNRSWGLRANIFLVATRFDRIRGVRSYCRIEHNYAVVEEHCELARFVEIAGSIWIVYCRGHHVP